MKKIIKIIFIDLLIILMLSGCTYRTDYIRKYNKELHEVFGEFDYEYFGLIYEKTPDMGSYKYKKWQINFVDVFGEKQSAIIDNTSTFESQIYNIVKNYMEGYIIENTLKKHFDCTYKKEILTEYVSNTCTSKEYNYYIGYKITFDTPKYFKNESYYDFSDYSMLDLTQIDVEKLISNEIVRFEYIKFIPNDKIVLSELENTRNLEYATKIKNDINDKITIDNAYYWKNINDLNYKGEPYIRQKEFDME